VSGTDMHCEIATCGVASSPDRALVTLCLGSNPGVKVLRVHPPEGSGPALGHLHPEAGPAPYRRRHQAVGMDPKGAACRDRCSGQSRLMGIFRPTGPCSANTARSARWHGAATPTTTP
jgi:hypothetical protein